MSNAYHCDADGCDSWVRTVPGFAHPSGFVTVTDTMDGTTIAHCCTLDCLMRWAAARSVPTEAVER
jgi:hypothetical protein